MRGGLTFGIAGGCGATGMAVVSELWRSGAGEILIGARNIVKARTLAAGFETRVSTTRVDVLDNRSLDDFCGRCSIIVNCAGPVVELEDRVAQAAFRARRHYVDLAGLSIVKERMLPHAAEIAAAGLSCVVSAGWLPGLTELVPSYAAAQAAAQMDSIDSVSAYFGDSGEWSYNACRDAAAYLRRFGRSGPAYFRKGERVRARMSQASTKFDPGGSVGTRRFNLFATVEFGELAARANHCDWFAYASLPSFRAALAGAAAAYLPMSNQSGARLLRGALKDERLPVGGFIAVRTIGRVQGRRVGSSVQLVYGKGQDYWTNGLVPATVARMIAEGDRVRPGVHFLADAVNPAAFIDQLRQAGVGLTENSRCYIDE